MKTLKKLQDRLRALKVIIAVITSSIVAIFIFLMRSSNKTKKILAIIISVLVLISLFVIKDIIKTKHEIQEIQTLQLNISTPK